MNKVKIIFGLGIWIAILPYLGFPISFKNLLTTITGLVIIYIAYILFKRPKEGEKKKETFDNFSENSNFNENESSQT